MYLYKDILSIIYNYKEDLEVHEKRLKVFDEINSFLRYEIGLCRICRVVIANNEIYNDNIECNHYFYLIKPIFLYKETDIRVLNQDLFSFYCRICDKYEVFYEHLDC